MRELIVTLQGQAKSDPECLHGHDGDRSDGGTDGDKDQGILPAIFRCHLIDHDACVDGNEEAI